MRLKLRPALYVLVPYLLGIVAGRWASVPFVWLWVFTLLCLIGSVLTRDRRYLCYGLLHVAIFAGGMLRLESVSESPIPAHFYDQPVSFSGETAYQPERGEVWDACYATGTVQLLADPTQTVSAKVLIRFQEPLPLRYEKRLTLTGVFRQPSARRNPGGFDYRAYLARHGVVGTIEAKGLLRVGEQRGFPPLRWIEALRIRTESLIDEIYTPVGDVEASLHAQILSGVLLGKRSEIPTETLEIFRNSGTFHVLAVSGLHVGLIATFCYGLFSCFRLPKRMIAVLTIMAVLIYACLIGFRPSVFRASLMTILFLGATLMDRDIDIYNVLAFAALVLLLINPQYLWDVGFQLSFVAVASIVYFVPKMEKPLRGLWKAAEASDSGHEISEMTKIRCGVVKWVVLSYLVTIAAQIGTGPLIAYYFFRAYPLGIVAGPFAVGLVSVIVAVGIISVCVGFLWFPLANLLGLVNHGVISVFLGVIATFGDASAVIKVTPPTLGVFVVYTACFLGIAHWRFVYRQWRIASLIGLSVAALWVWDAAFQEKGKLLEVTTLDVGQGDAAVVRFPDDRVVLIDGGIRRRYYDERKEGWVEYDMGKRVIEPYLDYRGIREIDMVVLTHPDLDHGGGLGYILENFRVGEVIGVSDMPLESPVHRRLHALVNMRNIPYRFPYAGEIPFTPTATLEVLHPIDADSVNLLDADTNDDSLVLKMSYEEIDVLFTGDIGEKAEARLVASGADLRSEILKVPHHGSRTSSTPKFLEAVQPGCAIFSLGQRNAYQLPHREVVDRYRARGTLMLRTDVSGAITIRTDGVGCWFESEL